MTIDELKDEVEGLNLDGGTSRASDYVKAYNHFIDFLEQFTNGQPSNADEDELKDTLIKFRQKLLAADLGEFARMEIWAKRLHEALVLQGIGEVIRAIESRNVAVPQLLDNLGQEIEKGNADAALLTQIKDAIEKGTKTIDELKTLVDALTATDADVKSRIRALITAARNISNTFMPDKDA
ncbi:MAG: hypothetical protein ABIP78_09495 [Pyrinomonadaceae bacterium]